ncbi:MAG: hypothetical protein ACLQSX_06355, partial [Smithella sp.]
LLHLLSTFTIKYFSLKRQLKNAGMICRSILFVAHSYFHCSLKVDQQHKLILKQIVESSGF